MVNPNYPVIEELWGPSWTAAGASLPSTRWVNLIDRTQSSASAQRGKQYELDQPQAGEYNIVLGSQDGALDPTNTGGPYASRILPYQPYRRRAQWPPTANVLDAALATGGEGYTAGSFPAAFGITVPSGSITGSIAVPGANAWQGTNVFQFAVANGTGVNSGVFRFDSTAIRPGKKITFSLYAANITASTSTSVIVYVSWINADGSVSFGVGQSATLVGSATPSYSRITVTATAPTTGAVHGVRLGMNIGATTTAASTIYVDGMQAEWASAATTWTAPGTWYPLFSGFTERWPTQWADGGTYGQVSPTAVDALALLSQVQLPEIFLAEIKSRNPRFCYSLADAAGTTAFADLTGNFPAAPLIYSKAGTGNWTAGNAVSSATANGGFIGSTGTVVTSAPSSPGSATAGSATMLDLTGAGITGPGGSAFTRMIAFRTSQLPTDILTIWETRTSVSADGAFDGHIRIFLGSDGWLRMKANTKNVDGSANFTLKNASMADGDWHLLVFGFDGTNFRYSIDGVASTSTYTSQPTLSNPVDVVGALWMPATRYAYDVYKGDLAFVTEFPSLLSEADMNGLYTAWRNAASGESTAARYSRILRYSGYTGASSVSTGLTSSMGPAVDLGGADVLSALNAVVETENGEHYVAADGTVTFRGRNSRYNALAPVLTFGDGPGELPFEDLQLDFDSTHLSNLAQVTQTNTGTVYTAQDSASIASYYTRTLSRSLNVASALEAQDAADYFISRYKQPLTRVQSIKIHPSAVPSLWPTLLALELGTRVRVIRRPVGGATVTVDCFVEHIQWDMDSNNEAFLTLQCSPIDPNPYTGFADWHTTLNGAPVAGATSITLNAGADNTNPLAAQLPNGTQLVIGLGTANQETVTVTSVPATTSGWTTATCGVTALTKSHSNGETVCEVLPSGVTDATYYDSTEQFGKAVFAY